MWFWFDWNSISQMFAFLFSKWPHVTMFTVSVQEWGSPHEILKFCIIFNFLHYVIICQIHMYTAFSLASVTHLVHVLGVVSLLLFLCYYTTPVKESFVLFFFLFNFVKTLLYNVFLLILSNYCVSKSPNCIKYQ